MARILIVDDESDFRMMLGKVLSMAGHSVSFAANGWEALLVLDGDGIDLIVLDIMMPGMDGPTLLRILRGAAKHRLLPVIVVSVLDLPETASRLGKVEVNGILKKGTQLEELVAKIDAIVGDRKSDESLPN
jgi:two-component system, OmpR family, response regulator